MNSGISRRPDAKEIQPSTGTRDADRFFELKAREGHILARFLSDTS
jgi:hypothetical protein